MLTVERLIVELTKITKLNPDYAKATLLWEAETLIEGGIAASKDNELTVILAPQKLDQMPGGF